MRTTTDSQPLPVLLSQQGRHHAHSPAMDTSDDEALAAINSRFLGSNINLASGDLDGQAEGTHRLVSHGSAHRFSLRRISSRVVPSRRTHTEMTTPSSRTAPATTDTSSTATNNSAASQPRATTSATSSTSTHAPSSSASHAFHHLSVQDLFNLQQRAVSGTTSQGTSRGQHSSNNNNNTNDYSIGHRVSLAGGAATASMTPAVASGYHSAQGRAGTALPLPTTATTTTTTTQASSRTSSTSSVAHASSMSTTATSTTPSLITTTTSQAVTAAMLAASVIPSTTISVSNINANTTTPIQASHYVNNGGHPTLQAQHVLSSQAYHHNPAPSYHNYPTLQHLIHTHSSQTRPYPPSSSHNSATNSTANSNAMAPSAATSRNIFHMGSATRIRQHLLNSANAAAASASANGHSHPNASTTSMQAPMSVTHSASSFHASSYAEAVSSSASASSSSSLSASTSASLSSAHRALAAANAAAAAMAAAIHGAPAAHTMAAPRVTGNGTVNPSVHPQFRSKAVCKLFCRHCTELMCVRGMRAILLGNTEVELFSTDIPPNGVQLVYQDYVTPNCSCRIRDAACLGCGNVVGYHVTQPCDRCLDACNNGHFWMFLSDAVRPAERFDVSGSKVLRWAALPYNDVEEDHATSAPAYEEMCR